MIILLSTSTILSAVAVFLMLWHIIREKRFMLNEATSGHTNGCSVKFFMMQHMIRKGCQICTWRRAPVRWP